MTIRGATLAAAVALIAALAAAKLAADQQAARGGQPFASLRELLAAEGFSDANWGELADGRPLDDRELATVLRVLYSLARVGPSAAERFGAAKLGDRPPAADPEAARGAMFAVSGRLEALEQVALDPPLAAQFELDALKRATIRLDDGSRAVVYAAETPRAWSAGLSSTARVSAEAAFVKLLADDRQRATPLLAARRLAWHPPTPLGQLGMDVGLLDEVRQRSPLSRDDREAFYQMLAAASRADPKWLARRASAAPDSVVPLFNDPSAQVGKLFSIEGVARRAVRVEVGDPDIRGRLGIGWYYEVDVFTDDSQGNPLVVCVRRLPDNMPQGDQIDVRVRILGFFFKVWAYPTRETELQALGESARHPRQLAPLLIAPTLAVVQPAVGGQHAVTGMIGVVVLLAVLAGAWLAGWWISRSDRRFNRRRALAQSAPDASTWGIPQGDDEPPGRPTDP